MKLKKWLNKWSKSQLVTLALAAAIPLAIALYAAHRFEQANAAAKYFQDKSNNQITTIKTK